MKSILISSVLFSSLIVALPTKHSSRAALAQTDIQMRTGDSDVDIGFSIAVGQLVPTNAQTQQGVSAIVADAGVFCQAFSDNAGAVKLGNVFTNTITGSFTNSSSGDIGSVAQDAVAIGAFCCVLSQDGFGVCSKYSGSSTSTSTSTLATSTATTTTSSSTTTTAFTATSTSPPTIRVQLNGASELAVQGEVPADDSVFLLSAHPPFISSVISASIVDAEGLDSPTCQAFSDAQGEFGVGGSPNGIGAIITEDDTDLSEGTGKEVKVLALKCKHA